MQTPLHPDSTLEKITLDIDGTAIQVLITFTKENQEIFIHQISARLFVVKAPQGFSLNEIKKQVKDYKKPPLVDEYSDTKKEHSVLSGGTIHIKGLDIPYSVVFNRRRKTLSLSIYPDGRIQVENPGTATQEDIIRFLNSEKEWIYREYFRTLPECPPTYEDQSIQIADTRIPYRISRSTRCTRITLKIHRNGKVEVSAPYDMPTDTIIAFVESRRSWIAPRVGISHPLPGHQEKQGGNGHTPEGETGQVTHLGEHIPYTIERSNRAKRITIKINRDRHVRVVCPPSVTVSDISAFMTPHAEWVYNHTI
ncbi:YgjP-like metallopeptidase domain-containing protein, partial [Methanospirillum sp.]